MANNISLIDVGNIYLGRGNKSLDNLIRKDLREKITQKDRRGFDVLHNIIQSDPGTTAIVQRSLYTVLHPADMFLAEQLEALGKTLNTDTSFPANKHSAGTAVSARQVKIQRSSQIDMPGSGKGNWAGLSRGYLKNIGFKFSSTKGKEGSPGKLQVLTKGQGKKRFWYERRRSGGGTGPSAIDRRRGTPMGAGAFADMQSLAAGIRSSDTLRATNDFRAALTGVNTFSSPAGVPDRFTVSADTKRRRASTYSRTSVKGKFYIVHSVTGDLLGPSTLSVDKVFQEHFSRITIDSMLGGTSLKGGNPLRPADSLRSIINAGSRDDWLTLLLANEYTRPWIANFFSRSKPYLIRHMREYLRDHVAL